ncbi:hypothetical protein FRC10_001701, partial [Ceratobasidium sp. 414]
MANFAADESDFTTVATIIDNGTWDSTPPLPPAFPGLTLAITNAKTITVGGASKDTYDLSAPLISKTFSEKVDQ